MTTPTPEQQAAHAQLLEIVALAVCDMRAGARDANAATLRSAIDTLCRLALDLAQKTDDVSNLRTMLFMLAKALEVADEGVARMVAERTGVAPTRGFAESAATLRELATRLERNTRR